MFSIENSFIIENKKRYNFKYFFIIAGEKQFAYG